MLWAIDVGNTHTLFGYWDGADWLHRIRISTSHLGTEDEIAARLKPLIGELPSAPVGIASVAPMVEADLIRFCDRYLGQTPRWLRSGDQVKIEVLYEPQSAVGADRIANALAGLRESKPPLMIVDFGTATTFDCLDASGKYLGGAILPGPDTLMDALTGKTAKLPKVPLEMPKRAIGRSTSEALQSGVVLAYLGSIDRLIHEIESELGPTTILCTGGLGLMMQHLHPRLKDYRPDLTLDGIKLFLDEF